MALDALLAIVPLAVILVLMAGREWGAAKAGPVGWVAAVALAVVRFGAGARLLALAHVKAMLLALDVLLIIWAAFLLYRVADEAGAIQMLSDSLPRLISDRRLQALLIGWPFASFLQGVGGFGVPTAVTAPLLVGLGFSPLAAVVIPSVGHAWSVTFGSLGSSFQALMAASGVPGPELAPASAALLGVIGFGCGVGVAHATDGWKAVRSVLGIIIIVGSVMGGVQLLLASSGLWNLAGFGAGLAGLLVGVVLSGRGRAEPVPRELWLALSGYGSLVVIAALVLLTPLREVLGQVAVEVPFPEIETSRGYVTPAELGRVIPIFRHAGAILLYASIATALIYRQAGLYRPGATRRILDSTLERVIPASLGIAALVSMAVIMSHAGMTQRIAEALAGVSGSAYPFAAPWIGALGAFMTGSNTNSNVLFGELQTRTAELLGYGLATVLAAQTAGGALGSVFAPSKIVVGAGTVDGQEGPILRRLLSYCVPLLLLSGVLVSVVAR